MNQHSGGDTGRTRRNSWRVYRYRRWRTYQDGVPLIVNSSIIMLAIFSPGGGHGDIKSTATSCLLPIYRRRRMPVALGLCCIPQTFRLCPATLYSHHKQFDGRTQHWQRAAVRSTGARACCGRGGWWMKEDRRTKQGGGQRWAEA